MQRVAVWGASATAGILGVVACGPSSSSAPPIRVVEPDMRLEARPTPRGGRCDPGQHSLLTVRGRRALMLVTPRGSSPRRSVILALHGAGSGGARGGLWAFRAAWDVPGLVLVAPAAAGRAWSLERRDVAFVDRALARAFARCPVDPGRVAVGGFSSGAGMALWLGLANGDLFDHVIALSPGGALPQNRSGRPRVFLAHGTRDRVIPIGLGGDRVSASLEGTGYRVEYRRFRGGHTVRPELVRRAVQQVLAG